MMQREKRSPKPLERIIRGMVASAVAFRPDEWILDERFTADVSSLRNDEIESLSRLLEVNRIIIPVYEALGKFEADSPTVHKLTEHLRSRVLGMLELKRHRDALLRRLASVFEHVGMDYVVFKTLNRLGSVGVDVDVIIDPSSYDRCVETFLANDFFSIDDLSKKYATGFMFKGNPIIVDLHTELAVLGVRYMPSDLLLRKRRSVMFQSCDGSEQFPLNVLDETVDALVRMAHCVLKERAVTIDDVAEVSHVFSDDLGLMVSYVEGESLRLATSIFSYIALRSLGAEQFNRLIMFDESFSHNLTKNILANSIHDSIPPFKLPATACMVAFINHLKERGELGKYAPSFIHSFKFRRNAAHLGRKVLERLGVS
jgi:hypothetical protein